LVVLSFAGALPVGAVACGGTESSASSGEHDAGLDGAVTMDGAGHADATNDSSKPSGDGGGADATTDAPTADAPYPAFAPLFPKLIFNGGYVMKHPVIVSITWNGDPYQADYDRFADELGGTEYWKATTSEYGVGPSVSGVANHVHLTTTAKQTTDQELQGMIQAHAGVDWPAATLDTAYVYFLPPTLSLQTQDPNNPDGGTVDACTQFGGYHDQIQIGALTGAYAVVPSCPWAVYDPDSGMLVYDAGPDAGGLTPEQGSTVAMSHELVEMVTDPHPSGANSQQGYIGLDSVALDWYVNFYDEAGDLCVNDPNANNERVETAPAPFDFWVQSTWSNKAGAAGHDPCQPMPPGASPYFNVTPFHLDPLTVMVPDLNSTDGGMLTRQTMGVHIPMGATQTIPVGFYSDGPTGVPWDLSVTLGASYQSPLPTYLIVNLDRTSGQNGDIAHATVTVTGTDTAMPGYELLVFNSTAHDNPQLTYVMPVLIASP
jgi:hypothetical protein